MDTLYALCSSHWTNNALDIALVVVLIVSALVGGKKGFIGFLFGFASTVLALVLVFTMAKPMSEWTNGLFGLGSVLKTSFAGSFAKISGFDIDISSAGLEAALAEHDVPVIFRSLVLDRFGDSSLAPGTTIATLLGEVTSDWAIVFLCGVLIFLLTKLLFRLLRGVFNGIVDKIPLLGPINALLGSLLGVLKILLIVCLILAFLTLIPVRSIGDYFSQSLLFGSLYNHNPLFLVISWIF